jgi:hypothetical protein
MKSTIRDSIGLPFTIFRAKDAIDYSEAETMHGTPMEPEQASHWQELVDAGMLDGSQVRLMFSRPGMSLTYAWFKSGFPLPRHSHSADCLYFIVAGALRIGTEELGPGDGFFVGNDVPYTYTPGPQGVEVLEFRTSNDFDIKMFANQPAYWAKTLAGLKISQQAWAEQAAPPSGLKVG